MSLIAKIGIDKTGFDAGLKAAEHQVKDFASHISSDLKAAFAGYFSYHAFKGLVESVAEQAVEISHLAKEYGITTDEVQQLSSAAKKLGLDFDNVGSGMMKLASARREAAEGNIDLRNSFQRYGLTLDDLQNPELRTIDLMRKIAAGAAGVNRSIAEADFRDFFGKTGGKLIEVFKIFDQQGPIKLISESDIEILHEAERSLERLKKNYQKSAAPYIAQFAKMFAGIFEGGFSYGSGLRGLRDEDNQERTVAGVPEGLGKLSNDKLEDISKRLNARRGSLLGQDGGEADIDALDAIDGKLKEIDTILKERAEGVKLFRDKKEQQDQVDLMKEEFKLQEQLDQNALHKLSDLGQRVVIQEKINKLLEDAKMFEGIGMDWEAANIRLEAAKLSGQIEKKDHSFWNKTSIKPESTHLGNIGASLGNTGTRSERILADNLSVLKTVQDILSRRGIVIASNGWR